MGASSIAGDGGGRKRPSSSTLVTRRRKGKGGPNWICLSLSLSLVSRHQLLVFCVSEKGEGGAWSTAQDKLVSTPNYPLSARVTAHPLFFFYYYVLPLLSLLGKI